MLFLLPDINFALALGGLALAVVTLGLFVDHFVFKDRYVAGKLEPYLWYLITATTIGSVAISLMYSEYFGYVPCSLCWLQRIAVYPQALMVLIAWRVRDAEHFSLYGIGLSIFGFLVAVYQYIYQMIPEEVRESGAAPCLMDGSGADCADKVINQFGFVTFPFLTAVTFAFLIILYVYLRQSQRSK